MQAEARPADAASALAAHGKVKRLLVAACDGDRNIFQEAAQALDEGQGIAKAVLDVKDANGRGALHFAAQSGKDEVCRFLVEELRLPVDPQDNDGETPLIHAVRQGYLQTSLYLLEHGADPKATSNELDASALHHAAGTGLDDVVRVLLEKGVNVDVPSEAGSPLIWAAGNDRLDTVKLLLDYGANPNTTTEDDVTALLTAAAAGSADIVDLLVKKGANVNVKAGGGTTPLHVAADNGNERMVTCLLNAGADPNALDEDDAKPLLAAGMKGYHEIVNILLPVTMPDPRVADWSVTGVLAFAEHLSAQEKKESEQERQRALDKKVKCESKTTQIEVSPERREKSLEAKSRGDEAFKKKNYVLAVDAYTQALDLDPNNASLFSNRSLCWMRLGQPEQALADAKVVRALRPDWAKGCYREGSALRLLEHFEEAANVFYEGVKLDPDSKELVDAFREAVEAGRKFHRTKEGALSDVKQQSD